ncbi:hypothetical protein N182_07075 [Sinorhizobium sp. GL2]|nr:hypothetical protein N182_07075 [Sinorhizobium sp. GL2]
MRNFARKALSSVAWKLRSASRRATDDDRMSEW